MDGDLYTHTSYIIATACDRNGELPPFITNPPWHTMCVNVWVDMDYCRCCLTTHFSADVVQRMLATGGTASSSLAVQTAAMCFGSVQCVAIASGYDRATVSSSTGVVRVASPVPRHLPRRTSLLNISPKQPCDS